MRPRDTGFWYGFLLAFGLLLLAAMLVVAVLLVVMGP